MASPDDAGKKAPGPPPRPEVNRTFLGVGVPPTEAPVEPAPARRVRRHTIQGVGPAPLTSAEIAAAISELGGEGEEDQAPSAPKIPVPPAPPRAASGAAPVVKVSPPAGVVVLIVGSDDPLQVALTEGLARHGMDVEVLPGDTGTDTIVATAPDLIVLVGDAARDSGRSVLERLGQSRISRAMPVAVLAEAGLGDRLQAFRYGAAAVIRRSASADDVASRIATIARQIPQRGGMIAGTIGDVTLDELIGAVAEQLKHEVAAVRDQGTDERNLRLVLSDGRIVANLIDEFVGRIKKNVLHAERLEESGAVASQLLADTSDVRGIADVTGLRLVIADDDPARADAVAHELRSRGADVLVTDLNPVPERFRRLRQADPIAVLIGNEQVEGPGIELVRRIRSDARLRWASLVVVRWDDVWPLVGGVERTLGTLAATADPERHLRERVEGPAPFDVRIESLGPARLLRALVSLPQSTRVTLFNPRLRVQVDVSNAIIAGAFGESTGDVGGKKLEAHSALAALLSVSSGRARIEHAGQPASVNLMSPVDVALELAEAEESPIVPSERIPIAPPSQPPPSFGVPSSTPPLVMPPSTPAPGQSPFGFGSAGAAKLDLQHPAEMMKRPIALPLWAIAVAGVVFLIGFIVIVARGPAPSRSSALNSAPSAARTTSEPASPKSGGVVDRARAGDPAALAELEARPPEQRGIDEAVAIAEAPIAQRRHAFEELKSGIDLSQPPKPDVIKRLLEFARDPDTASQALAQIAAMPGSLSADLVYEVWTKTPGRPRPTALAEQLAQTEPVRKKASPGLLFALDLKRAKTCEEFANVLERKDDADARAVPLIGKLMKKTGCGANKLGDCWPCLRSSKTVEEALTAARQRPGPKF